MAMTRSRRAPSTKAITAPTAALPALAGYSEEDIQFETFKLLEELKAAGSTDNQVTVIGAWIWTHRIKSDAYLALLFERIEKLETALRKGIKASSADARFSFDDLKVEQIDDRNVELILRKDAGQGIDEATFRLTFPVVIDRGTWSPRGAYERGDGVTHKGSFWIAQVDNPGEPDTAESGFRLAVKRGKDGRDMRT